MLTNVKKNYFSLISSLVIFTWLNDKSSVPNLLPPVNQPTNRFGILHLHSHIAVIKNFQR